MVWCTSKADCSGCSMEKRFQEHSWKQLGGDCMTPEKKKKMMPGLRRQQWRWKEVDGTGISFGCRTPIGLEKSQDVFSNLHQWLQGDFSKHSPSHIASVIQEPSMVLRWLSNSSKHQNHRFKATSGLFLLFSPEDLCNCTIPLLPALEGGIWCLCHSATLLLKLPAYASISS